MMTSLGEYIYTTEGNTVYQNLFIGSDMKTEVNGKEITLHVTTSYPWEETVSVRVESMEERHLSMHSVYQVGAVE